MDIPDDRHPGTKHFAAMFGYEHLSGPNQAISKECHDLAEKMIASLPDGPELTSGLRKLWEAKNCFVMQNVVTNYGKKEAGL